MYTEKQLPQQSAGSTRNAFQQKPALHIHDNRPQAAAQAQMVRALQCSVDDDELLQGKFTAQRQDDEDLLQGKFTAQRASEPNLTGMPDNVKQRMENSFGTDFSGVRIHADSPSASEVGALAYTQGTDVHFAPGQFKPDTTAGQKLIGHELAHVVQQQAGQVAPTTEISGMPVNDNPALENEADRLGDKAANS